LVWSRKISTLTTSAAKMQFAAIFIICFIVIIFFMFVLSKKKSTGSCSCGRGNCQTGTPCEEDE